MIKASVARFLGPVKSVHSAFTELTDGGLYISAEQYATLLGLIKSKGPSNLVDFTLGLMVGHQLAEKEREKR